MSAIFERFSTDYTMTHQYARRADGQWFTRTQSKGPWGYRWNAWRECCEPGSERLRKCEGRKARLPKAVAA